MVQRIENNDRDWRQRIAFAFDRFVSRDVTDHARRRRQSRLLGSIMLITVLLIVLSVPLAAAQTAYLAFPFLAGATGCLLCALLAASGRETLTAVLTGLFAVIFAAILLKEGGSGSALAFLIMTVPVVEAWWALRRPVLTGFAGALALGASVAALFTGWAASGGTLWSVAASAILVVWLGTLLLRMPVRAENLSESAVQTDEAVFSHVLLDDLPAAIVTFADDGELIFANGKVEEMMGVAPQFLLGQAFFERVHVADRVQWLNALADARTGTEAKAAIRLRTSFSGEMSYADLLIRLSPMKAGRVTGLLIADADSAARDLELGRLREEAAVLANTRNRFLATVSHELRTPLNAIIGFADMISSDVIPNQTLERQREYAELISKSGGHLLKVVNAILDISKMEAGTYAIQREPFDPIEALDMPISIASQQGEREGVAISRQIPVRMRPLNADRRSFQQILINLLSNAVKFTPEGGEVQVSFYDDGRNFVLAVRDTGIGIAAEDLPRLGKPFMQLGSDSLAREHDGTGLGLSLVKGMVELLGGHMQIESRLGNGTEVTVTIPNLGVTEAVPFNIQNAVSEKTDDENHALQQRRSA